MKPDFHIHTRIQRILKDLGWGTPAPSPATDGSLYAWETLRKQHDELATDAFGREARENHWVQFIVWTGLHGQESLTTIHGIGGNT